MGWVACPRCGVDRKYGDVVSEDGSIMRRCLNCGDDERTVALQWQHVAEMTTDG